MAKKKKDSKRARKKQILLASGLVMAIVFLPSTMLLMAGMVPTFVAFFVDGTVRKTKVFTVGAMNLAGCTPFLFELWTHGNDFDASIGILIDPKALIVMYCAAAVGYMIDWVMTAFVSGIMYQRGVFRRRDIEKKQKDLIDRWGAHVKGDVPLDEHGFPKNQDGGPPSSQ